MNTKVTLEIVPRPLQRQILESNGRRQVIVAHRRFGKTTVALLKILKNAKKDNRFFYIAPTYKQAKMIAWDMLNKLVPKEIIRRKNEVELFVELINGAKIELKGSDNPDSLRGIGLNGVVFDEYAQQDPSIYSEIIRAALADKQGWALFIGTPKGKNHFYNAYLSTPETDRYLLKASQTEILSKDELELAKSEMSVDEYNQEFECDFLYFSGQIYKEFNPSKHVIKPFDIRDDQGLVYMAIDYGQVNPTCVLWFLVDYDGKVYVIDEHYEPGHTVAYHCEAIKKRPYNIRTLPLLDPSAFNRTRSRTTPDGEVMYSVADEFSENGVICTPANNEVSAGINRVKEAFQNDKLFIFKNCEKLLWEINNYRWKDHKKVDSNAPEEPLKMNDHAVDALRYFILSRPTKPKYLHQRTPLEARRHALMHRKTSKDWYND